MQLLEDDEASGCPERREERRDPYQILSIRRVMQKVGFKSPLQGLTPIFAGDLRSVMPDLLTGI